MIALAIIGMIVLFGAGAIVLIAAAQMTIASYAFTGKFSIELLAPFLVSALFFGLGIWLNPFTISISAGVAP